LFFRDANRIGAYLWETKRRNRDGSTVSYLQLANSGREYVAITINRYRAGEIAAYRNASRRATTVCSPLIHFSALTRAAVEAIGLAHGQGDAPQLGAQHRRHGTEQVTGVCISSSAICPIHARAC
jgi:hypothetical protein